MSGTSPLSPGFDHLPAGRGTAIVGRGPGLAEAFAEAARGVFALLAPPDQVSEREVREVRAHGESLERLLESWVAECLYVHDIEGFVARRIELIVFEASPRPGGEPLRLHAILHGEEMPTESPAALEGPYRAQVALIPGGAEARLTPLMSLK
ncbi:MAG: archease [Candidatus Rokubacteria bacterium]|nr:archease [Candidatus Rokubacteria bacterium]